MTADLFGLLTRVRLPGRTFDLQKAADQQYLFPLVGVVVGLIAATAALALSEVLGGEHAIISGGLVLVLLYYVTGILHTEGLSDFADGIMAHGSPERKLEAMKDAHAGVAGAISVVLYLLLFFAATAEICEKADRDASWFPLPWGVPFAIGFVLSEISGKLAMNTTVYLGPSAHEGMGSVFVRAATLGKLIIALAIGTVAAILAVGLIGALVLVGPVVGATVALTARKHLGGVSGDVFGAANEIGRLTALIAWVLIA